MITPPLIFIVVFLANFISLATVALAKGRSISVLFKNPAFYIGDFILVPAYFSILKADYFSVRGEFLVLSFFFILFWGHRHKLLQLIWLPHGLVAIMIIYFYLVVLAQRDFETLLILSGLLLVHQLLGVFFPKKIG